MVIILYIILSCHIVMTSIIIVITTPERREFLCVRVAISGYCAYRSFHCRLISARKLLSFINVFENFDVLNSYSAAVTPVSRSFIS